MDNSQPERHLSLSDLKEKIKTVEEQLERAGSAPEAQPLEKQRRALVDVYNIRAREEGDRGLKQDRGYDLDR